MCEPISATSDDEYKKAFSEHMWFEGPVAAVTLATNAENQVWAKRRRASSFQKLETDIYEIDGYVSRKLLGRNFYDQKRRRRRIEGWLVIEAPDTNIHLHGELDLKGHRIGKVRKLYEEAWKKRHPGGSIVLEWAHEPKGWQQYSLKSLTPDQLKVMNRLIIIPRR